MNSLTHHWASEWAGGKPLRDGDGKYGADSKGRIAKEAGIERKKRKKIPKNHYRKMREMKRSYMS